MYKKYFILPLVLVVSHVLNQWPTSFHFENFSAVYQLHCFSRLISPVFILYRRNKKYGLMEWLYVLCWLVMKIIIPWVVFIMYWNEAGILYSHWVSISTSTPVYNPWTNPPAFVLVVVALMHALVESVQTYEVMINSKSLI